MPNLDPLGRPELSTSIKQAIDTAFDGVKGRGALLVIADDTGTRAHLAEKIGDHWKIAAGVGVDWKEKKPSGFIAIQAVW